MQAEVVNRDDSIIGESGSAVPFFAAPARQ